MTVRTSKVDPLAVGLKLLQADSFKKGPGPVRPFTYLFSMTPLTTGRYTITNARFNNVLALPNENHGYELVSGAQKDVPHAFVTLGSSCLNGN